ncbi:MAG: hypothetical protein LUQ59_00355 [Methanothrix sp.]|nr:hypothetical protein [Methanothrix sp.]
MEKIQPEEFGDHAGFKEGCGAPGTSHSRPGHKYELAPAYDRGETALLAARLARGFIAAQAKDKWGKCHHP